MGVGVNYFPCCCLCRSLSMQSMASSEEISLMGDFLEDARLGFQSLPFGSSVEATNMVFWEFAALSRRHLPADVLVVVRVHGRYRQMIRRRRWAQRQLLRLSEATVSRCRYGVTRVEF